MSPTAVIMDSLNTPSIQKNMMDGHLSLESQRLVQRIILELLQSVDLLKKNFGIQLQAFSLVSQQQLLKESQDSQIKLLQHFSNFNKCLKEQSSLRPFKSSEKYILQEALKKIQVCVSEDFWMHYSEDDITELYSADMIQLFRSYNFYTITGYSLLDMSMFPWYQLWERPKVYIDNLQKEILKTLADEQLSDCVLLDIPRHLIKENFNNGMTEPFVPKLCWAQFKVLAPLRDIETQAVTGFIITSSGGIVESIDNNISFI